jgi:SAM-dependent methyltransferase
MPSTFNITAEEQEMCNDACLAFARLNITESDVKGKTVLEVGSLDVNGSFRPIILAFQPAKYVGVDINMGPGVDEICDVLQLTERFGRSTFDMVVTTEMLEHVRDWRMAISNLKGVLKAGGTLVVTTRSKGFKYHEFPYDFWRYEKSDMERIFSDFVIHKITKDHLRPGIFLKATKSEGVVEADLSGYKLYSIVTRKRSESIGDRDMEEFMRKHGGS